MASFPSLTCDSHCSRRASSLHCFSLADERLPLFFFASRAAADAGEGAPSYPILKAETLRPSASSAWCVRACAGGAREKTLESGAEERGTRWEGDEGGQGGGMGGCAGQDGDR